MLNIGELKVMPLDDKSKWEKFKYSVHDTIVMVEKIHGPRRYWFMAGLSAGLGISSAFLLKSRLLGVGIGLANLVIQAGSLIITNEVMKSDLKEMSKIFKPLEKVEDIINSEKKDKLN